MEVAKGAQTMNEQRSCEFFNGRVEEAQCLIFHCLTTPSPFVDLEYGISPPLKLDIKSF